MERASPFARVETQDLLCHYTMEQVCAFLEANGHDAHLFEEYRVDGTSLLNMGDEDLKVTASSTFWLAVMCFELGRSLYTGARPRCHRHVLGSS